jgi:hypothetical protein
MGSQNETFSENPEESPKEANERERFEEEEGEGFDEIIRYTVPGYILGLVAGIVFDHYGWQRSAVGQWFVRTVAGEGESIFEGLYAFRKRLSRARDSMAEAYGWGKFIGMFIPWLIDGISRLSGIDVYGIEGFYIPYFYALSDQIGANVSGFFFLKRKTGTPARAVAEYVRHPVMLTSLGVILLVPVGLFLARVAGFSPTTQVYTAVETIAANLCWLPPLVGWFVGKRKPPDRSG